jgi:hypothetical protein
MYLELETEVVEDAVALFTNYIRSKLPVEFTVRQTGTGYKVRVIRIDRNEVNPEITRDSHIAKKSASIRGQKRSDATRQLMRESALKREAMKKKRALLTGAEE